MKNTVETIDNINKNISKINFEGKKTESLENKIVNNVNNKINVNKLRLIKNKINNKSI